VSSTSELDLAKVQAPIFSYFNGRVIKCPASLLAQLQWERAQHERIINADTGEAFSNALLDQAEKIKRNISEQHE
jgi:hypothetical protein